MPNTGVSDWLSGLASTVGTVGSFIGSGLNPMPGSGFGVEDVASVARKAFDPTPGHGASWQDIMGVAGNVMGAISDKDPTKLLTAPILSPLHGLGIGAQGDEWDKGAIGLLGAGFSKIGALATYAALAPSPFSDNFGAENNKKAWDMAFSKENPVDFGGAIMGAVNDQSIGHQNSVLTDPNGLKDLHANLDSTWYGNFAAGAMTFGMYAALDPTKGVGKLAKAGRAANYVADPMHADRLAGIVNKIDETGVAPVGGNLSNTARGIVGLPVDDAKVAGRLMSHMARTFRNDTDINSVLNKLDPTLLQGGGTDAARMAGPVIAEAIADASKIKDPLLQAQAHTNIMLAASNSSISMKWMADNLPMAAAKLRRASQAPSEFTLLRNVMDDAEANGLQSLDMGAWVDAHYGSAANASELKAYASSIEDVRRFKQTIEQGGFGGGEVSFRTSAAKGSNEGVMVVPRTLEKLKAGLNQSVMDSHLLQGGQTGRSIRVINSLVTPHAPGTIHLADPILGNKQLMNTMKAFSDKMRGPDGADAFAPEHIQALSETFLKASPAERSSLVDSLNDALITKVAEHYSANAEAHGGFPMTTDNIRQIVATSNAAKSGGRAYATAKVKAAQAAGELETKFGDMSGTDTVLNTANMAEQLDTTGFLWDWNSAHDAVDGFYKDNRITSQSTLNKAFVQTGAATLKGVATYHRIWKNAVLLRPGLAVRAIEDTGLRSAVTIGTQNMALQAITGALNIARNHGNGLLSAGDSARMTMTAGDRLNVARAQNTIDKMDAVGEAQAVKIMDRTIQNTNTSELAESLSKKIHNGPTVNPAAKYNDPNVGMVPTSDLVDLRTQFRLSDGPTGRGDTGANIIEGIRADIRSGKGITKPIVVEYEPGSGWATVGDGHHRLEAAMAENLSHVPVKVRWSTAPGGHKMSGLGQSIQTSLGKNFPAGESHPSLLFKNTATGASKPGAFHSLSKYYANAEQRAIDLGMRQRSAATTVGGGQPLGLKALNDQFAAEAPVRKQAIAGLEQAKTRYTQGAPNKLSNLSSVVRVNGYQFSAVKNDMEKATAIAESQGGGTAASMYAGEMSKDYKGLRVDTNHGSDHIAPDDAHWPEMYAQTATALRGSYTAHRLLTEKESLTVPARTDAAVVRSYLNDPKVVAEYRELSLPKKVEGPVVDGKPTTVPVQVRGEHLGDEGLKTWLSQLNDSVHSMAPHDAAWNMLTGSKPVTSKMAADAFKGEDRFPIFGPDVFRDPVPNLIEGFYKYTLNMPDVYLARVPMVNGLYRANLKELVPRYIERATAEGRTVLNDKELAQIHSQSMQGALNDVRRDMYDVHRNVGAHGVASMISPFFAPWEDAMVSWSRIMYDNPAIAGKLMRYSQLGDMFHVVTDKDGKPTQAWDGTAMGDKYINIPLAGAQGLLGQRLNVGSFNSIQQGNVPFSPGVGPLVQLGSVLMVGQGLTHMGGVGADMWNYINAHPDNVINQTMLPQGGASKAGMGDVIGSQMPSYMRKLTDAVFSDSPFSFGNVYSTAYGTRYNDLITQFRAANGGRDPSKSQLLAMQGQADSGARAAAMSSAAFSWGLGLSGNAVPEGQMYLDKQHALNQMTPALAAQGLTPGGVFATMYPNAARLNWSFSVNEGRLTASVNATSSYYKNKTLMDANRESMWWIAGPDNILANLGDPDTAGKTFSQAAYNQQMTAGLLRRYTKSELNDQADIAMGYGQLANFDSTLSLYMRQNGIKSLNAKNAGNLSVMKNEFVTNLGLQFPAWERDRSTMDLQRKARQINQIQAMAENPPPALKDRPDVLTTQKYLFARQSLVNNAHDQGVTAWQTSKTQLANRHALWQYGQTLAASDIVFQQAWSRLFETEFKGDMTPTVGA